MSNDKRIIRLTRNLERQQAALTDTEQEIRDARKANAPVPVISSLITKETRQRNAVAVTTAYLNIVKKLK